MERFGVSNWHIVWSCFVLGLANLACSADEMILVVGAGGTDEYAATFAEWADQWQRVAQQADMRYQEIGRSTDANDYEQLKAAIDAGSGSSEQPLWIVLLGHGTFDREIAKFNLRGKDVEANELKQWLTPLTRPLILVNGFSCSGAFLQPLHAPNRVVITATKNGAELNFARFGGFLAQALTDMTADLDHDDQVSLLEAFLLASSNVNQFYESDARLVTEHALLEDNHDGKGIPADFFQGIRAKASAQDGAALDGALAHRFIVKSSPAAATLSPEQLAERDRIETQIEELRQKKSSLAADRYFDQLEELMVALANIYLHHAATGDDADRPASEPSDRESELGDSLIGPSADGDGLRE